MKVIENSRLTHQINLYTGHFSFFFWICDSFFPLKLDINFEYKNRKTLVLGKHFMDTSE